MSTQNQSVFITTDIHYDTVGSKYSKGMFKPGKGGNIRSQYLKQLIDFSLVVYLNKLGEYSLVKGTEEQFEIFEQTRLSEYK
jgi:hypothetical protein